jgi:hypothetical protein
MNKCIIHPTPDGRIAVIFPVSTKLTIEQIAQKDVPAGVPYFIVETATLPSLDDQEAWEANFSAPHGYGIGPDAWAAANPPEPFFPAAFAPDPDEASS